MGTQIRNCSNGVQELLLDTIHKSLLITLVERLPAEARIALCCAGKFLNNNWQTLEAVLAGRHVVAVLDDAPEKLAESQFRGVPLKPVNWATPNHVDAILITSDRAEDRMARRLAPLTEAGITILRTFRLAHNRDLTPEMLEAVVEGADPDVFAAPRLWEQPLPAHPPAVGVEINNGCNINCVMCETHSAARPLGEMSLDMFQATLDRLDAVNCKTLTYHTVGEPTIHPQFEDILRISSERGFEVMLSTNGLLIHRFLDALIRWPVSVIRFSVDGATKETYERIRVGGNFERLLSNLHLIRDAVTKHDLPTSIQMAVTLSLDNLREVPLFFDVYGSIVDDNLISFSPVNSLSAGDGSYYGRAKLIDLDRSTVPCPLLWSVMHVGYDGRVSPCCRDYHGELIVGDTTEQTLEEIWNGPALNELRDKHAAGDMAALPRACRNCYTAGTGPSALISFFITSLRQASPDLDAEEFERRTLSFIGRLGQVESQSMHPQAAPSAYRLPVVN